MFLTMFVVSLVALIKNPEKIWPAKINAVVSLLGILFAGYFVTNNITRFLTADGTANYALVLPTCVYGLVFYIIIFILSLIALRRKEQQNH